MKKIRENLLRKIAQKSDHKSQKHSAIILKGSTLISQGYNQGIKHAEEMAINKIRHKIRLTDCILISFRTTKKGTIGKSRPCNYCMLWIKEFGPESVIYFDGKEWIQEKIKEEKK